MVVSGVKTKGNAGVRVCLSEIIQYARKPAATRDDELDDDDDDDLGLRREF